MSLLLLLVLLMMLVNINSFHTFMNRIPRQYLTCAYASERGWEPDFARFKEGDASKVFKDLVSAPQWLQIEEMTARLYDWNSKINLVSRKDIDNLVESHVIPCMSIACVQTFQKGERIIDIGTGGGLPGLPMAILNPEVEFTLIDSVGKKLIVVEDICRSLKLNNVKVVHDRAENHAKGNSYDFLMGRAVSNLPHFLTFSCDLMAEQGEAQRPGSSGLLYLKGGDFFDEIDSSGVTEYKLEGVQALTQQSIISDKVSTRLIPPSLSVNGTQLDWGRYSQAIFTYFASKKYFLKTPGLILPLLFHTQSSTFQNVLFIPAPQILSFRKRRGDVEAWLAEEKKKRKQK